MYPRVRHFWIYTTVSFFKKTFSHLSVCVLKILSILKKKSTNIRYLNCKLILSLKKFKEYKLKMEKE